MYLYIYIYSIYVYIQIYTDIYRYIQIYTDIYRCTGMYKITRFHLSYHSGQGLDRWRKVGPDPGGWDVRLGRKVCLPSGELTFCHGKSPFFMGKSTISMAIFNSFLLVHQRVIHVESLFNPFLLGLKRFFFGPERLQPGVDRTVSNHLSALLSSTPGRSPK